ncbi:MAG: ACT domain-containing protein [Oscillospiraceae bacterium]|nr:ACT domain-containing protein [Oscillospiraceae bacterium]
MRLVITVIGKDKVGILAKVSSLCAEYNANITDVTQSVLQDLFAMVMLAETEESDKNLAAMSDALTELGDGMGLKIHVMHEDVFNTMHRI